MNIVLVKHNDHPKQFAFYVPDELIPFVKKDQGVLCQTMRGLAYGTTTTGVITGDGAKDIAIANGAYIPLKPIVAFEHPMLAKAPEISREAKQDFMAMVEKAFGMAK